MDVREKTNQIHASKVAVIRAIRTAALVLSDAEGDLNLVDSLIPDEAEAVEARTAAWSVVEPLLSELARNVRALSHDSCLASLPETVEKCNQLLQADRDADSGLPDFSHATEKELRTILKIGARIACRGQATNDAGVPNHAE